MSTITRESLQSACRLVVPVLTPFETNGDISLTALGRLCAFLSKSRFPGIFTLGSSGELPLYGKKDRCRIIQTSREHAPKSILFAGVSGTGWHDVLDNIEEAKGLGANVAVAMAPFFIKLSQEELYNYCCRLADKSALPLTLYNHRRNASIFSVELLDRLKSHQGIVAIKETMNDIQRIPSICQEGGKARFTVFQGNENLMLESFKLNADGIISTLANVVPSLFVELIDAWELHDERSAQEYQERINQICLLFQHPEVSECLSALLSIVRVPLHAMGMIPAGTSLVGGYVPSAEFKHEILETFRPYID